MPHLPSSLAAPHYSTTYSAGSKYFTEKTLVQGLLCSPVVRLQGEKAMKIRWKFLGEANRRWVPTQEVYASHAGGTTSGLCPSGALPPPPASAIGAASGLLPETRPPDLAETG